MKRGRMLDIAFLVFFLSSAILGRFMGPSESSLPSQNPEESFHFGYVGLQFTGVYHTRLVQGQVGALFYLQLSNGSLIQLLFFCLKRMGFWTVNGLCEDQSDVPYSDGQTIWVNGTMLEPSDWNSTFLGDLYVFQSHTA